MSKSYVDQFYKTIEGVLADACDIDPLLRVGCQRDLISLMSLVEKRGPSVYLMELPTIGRALDRALDDGFLPLLALPLAGRVNTRTTIPRLFQGIWLKLFSSEGVLRQDVDPTFVLILRQLLYVGHKYEVAAAPERLYSVTKEFFDVERILPPTESLWDNDGTDLSRSALGHLDDRSLDSSDCRTLFSRTADSPDVHLLDTCQRVADCVVSEVFSGFDREALTFRHGPGATAGFRRGREYKYTFAAWSPRLETQFQYDRVGMANPSLLADLDSEVVFAEEASRLIDVPKTAKGPRLIAAEPTCHQWVQQGLAGWMADKIRADRGYSRRGKRSYGLCGCIDFRNQAASGYSALEASRDGQKATIDLKSASDRLSCWLVQRLFRTNPELVGAFVASRTRYMRNTLDKKYDSLIKLRKFATMGSALTFPIQSVVFTMLAIAAGCETLGVAPHRWRTLASEVRVYGDDMIVPVSWVAALRVIFKSCHLEINELKTFSGKNFRESCGVDAFRGYDVTPVKVKKFPDASKPSTIISAVDTSNLFHRKGLWRTAAYLTRAVTACAEAPVVGMVDGVWGVQTFSKGVYQYRTRYNSNLQRMETRLFQPRPKQTRRERVEGVGNLLQFFTEDPTNQILADWESGRSSTTEGGYGRRWVPVSDLSLYG
ncbi:RNA-directed RNA polymerase, partial [ssRNA phage SRR6960799_37]